MIDRKSLQAVVLAGAAVAVVIMAVWGVNAATAPIENDDTASTGPGCPIEDQTIKESVARAEVTVSVYNTGKKVGRGETTLNQLEAMGFRPGALGNGAEGDKVPFAEVRYTRENSASAELVALAMGKDVKVVVVEEAYGPGVDIFIGDKFKRVDAKAPKRVRFDEPVITCD